LFLEAARIDPESLVCAEQVHADGVHYAAQTDCGRSGVTRPAVCGVDAFITDRKNVPLAVFSADCCCVFLYDPVTPAVGLVHAGWKGTALGIAAKTLDAMRQQFGSDPAKVIAGFSPSIRGCCYEIGDEVAVRFPGDVLTRGDKRYLDLVQCNTDQLTGSGLVRQNIFDAGLCTCCHAEFFSYRREGAASGRMMSVVMLV
jgi:hypothetical protein